MTSFTSWTTWNSARPGPEPARQAGPTTTLMTNFRLVSKMKPVNHTYHQSAKSALVFPYLDFFYILVVHFRLGRRRWRWRGGGGRTWNEVGGSHRERLVGLERRPLRSCVSLLSRWAQIRKCDFKDSLEVYVSTKHKLEMFCIDLF